MLMMIFLMNLDYLTSVIISACVLPLFIMLLKKAFVEGFALSNKSDDESDSPPIINQTILPKKANKKLTVKRRKNREISSPSKLSNQENIDIQMENCQKTGVLEEAEKGRGKNKKNRNHSPPSRSAADIYTNQPKTVKIYTPLEIFVNLNLQISELYRRFSSYVLFAEQMKSNGFPMECPSKPGKAVFKGCGRYPLLNSPNDRICSRCKEKYTVLEDGSYQSETTCCYHSGKRQRIGEIYNAGAYSCCGNPGTSDGCIIGKQHVSAYGCLDKVKFVKTREKRPIPNNLILALDCEMCYTVQGLEVTRITLVGTDGLAVYDTFVLPENPIVDYNTTYSGITANDLKGVQTTLADVQACLLKMLSSSTILIGHGLENDLKALHLIHETVIDTSVVFASSEGNVQRKLSLKTLASAHLQKTIQEGLCGHDSVEDARTCMELMLHKIQKDSQVYVPPQQETFIPVVTPAEPPTTYWQRRPLSINPVMIPYVRYWVPPVGSACDLY